MRKLFYIISIIILCIILADEYESEEEEIQEEVYNRMNYIIDNIYLGDTNVAGNETYLEENNITVVVNCASGYTSNYKKMKSLELNLYDDNTQILFPKFHVAYKFVKEYKEKNILVHCLQGKSRSPSFVIFYLMKEKRWDFDTCLSFVLEKRPIVNPISGFVRQLKDYYDKYINNSLY